jgi:hypothetical protein
MAALVRSDITFLPMQVPLGEGNTMPAALLQSDHQLRVLTTVRGDGATMPGRAMEQCSAH